MKAIPPPSRASRANARVKPQASPKASHDQNPPPQKPDSMKESKEIMDKFYRTHYYVSDDKED